MIRLGHDERVRNLLGNECEFRARGLYIPHTIETTRLLRNIGYAVPAPIISYYKWPVNPAPFRTQKITAALLTMNPRAYVLSEMGTGKTRGGLFAIDYMLQEQIIKRVLVVAPLSTLSQVWDREIFQCFPELSTTVLHGTRKRRLKRLSENHDIYIINHDGVGSILPELIAKDFDVVLIDEVGAYRNKSTDRWKAMSKLLVGRAYVWGMTGSPAPNEPTDAWGISKLMTPEKCPRYYKQFRDKTMRQVTQFKWVPKKDAIQHVYNILQPAVRYRRSDCFELPDTSYQTHEVSVSKEIEDTYSKLLKAAKAAFKEGLVTAANEAVVTGKLAQVSSGYVYTRDKRVVKLDNKHRLNETTDIIDQSLGKIIVFAAYTHTAKNVHAHLVKKGYDAAFVHGGTTKKQRDEIFSAFQNTTSIRVLVAHPKCMSHGLTLTAASTIVWFTPPPSLETYEQANARITRTGQLEKTLIIGLTGTPIERKIYKRLEGRAKIQGALLDLFDDEE